MVSIANTTTANKFVSGYHHVTAIASSPQKNYDFYHGVLGLRLVKQTVNFDDPSSYHLYYGDELAKPGSLITFFTWPHLPVRTRGAAEIAAVGFAVPVDSLDFWKKRLTHKKIKFTEITRGEFSVLSLEDFEGMGVEIVGVNNPRDLRALHPDIPKEHALCGIEYTVLSVANVAVIAQTLETIGYSHVKTHDELHHFSRVHDHVFVFEDLSGHDALQGIGAVHHIAFAVSDDSEEMTMRSRIHDLGLFPTPQIDRTYFHSVYFREHNGILFEIATNGPGFAIDEKIESLGQKLCLPPQYEKQRAEIVANLQPFKL